MEWTPLEEASLPDLKALAESCLRRDGGLPMLADEQVLRQLFLTGTSYGIRDDLGELIAASAIGFDATGQRTVTGLVHHSFLGLGLGQALAKWVSEQTAGAPLHIIMESLSPEAEQLYAELDLKQTYAERVMRHRSDYVPIVRKPEGITMLPFSDDTAPAFKAVHAAAFADHPGFTDAMFAKWTDYVKREKGFRPQDSRVAFDAQGRAVGFVTLSDGWIDQVGVIPEWQGRRLGAHLVARSVRALRRAGFRDVWLCVAVGNPARELYERLGFTSYGKRARYEQRSQLDQFGRLVGQPETDEAWEGSPS